MRCEVWWARPEAATVGLIGWLDDHERERHANYRRDADKLRFLTGRTLIRMVAGEWLGIAPERVVLDASCYDCGKPHGKPRVVADGAPEVSISHSGDRVVLAATDGPPVGIDVEELRDTEVDSLAATVFSAAELHAFRALPAGERKGAFFMYWARKEAVVKTTGRGMSVPMSKLTLSSPGVPPKLLESTASEVDAALVHLLDLDAGPDYRASVAVLSATAPGTDWVTEHDAQLAIAEHLSRQGS
jgi:4'-phosphopantetheinyl transferase